MRCVMAADEISTASTPAAAKHGMVATSEPLAVEVGLEVLKNGGNAIDAAVAAGAMIGLTEPMSCGIGGDLFAIVWDAQSQKLYGLNASGRSPYKANRELFAERGLRQIPTYGPLSWSVPGCVDGWDELLKRFGTRSLAELLQPAIRTADEGFTVAPGIGRYWQAAAGLLRRWPDSEKTYLPEGRAPGSKGLFRNPNLARSYRLIAEGGRDAFYRGPIAAEIVAASDRVGGLFSLKDFEDHTSTWVEPVSTSYRGYDVWELPPNGQGIAALQMLNMLEAFDLKSLGQNSAEYLHLLIEAKKLAFEDRARYYADPEFADVPVKELISKAYAARRRQLIDRERALRQIDLEDPRLAASETIYMTVVDKDRNAVSYIQSNYHGFGSGVVPGELGFALQNRGNLFALDADHPNRLEPHKRPFHTIIPALVTKDGKPWLSFGVMGGDMQPQGHVQVLLNMLEFGMDPQTAGAAPRFCHFGSSTPTGQQMTNGGEVGLEHGIDDSVRDGLVAKGHRLLAPGGEFGGYQAIRIDGKSGMLVGGSDPRKDGYAKGF
ncbi:MAG: gamma-glutamyltransferase [Planctomycetes bacterium]|nr:gamma-glutamyltransferase [Planctomycetota bacterium]